MTSTPAEDTSSSLSSHSDEEFSENLQSPSRESSMPAASDDIDPSPPAATKPPKKRRRIAEKSKHRNDSPSSSVTNPTAAVPAVDLDEPIAEPQTDISSDTSGSVPGSPKAIQTQLAMPDEELISHELVQACAWDGCTAGDLHNQDALVTHVMDEHVGHVKRSKYTCEWSDCKAKGKPQLSAYALRAHMRSHTKEKPFYCSLPECDRSFTRSDALTKHTRTVHEIHDHSPKDKDRKQFDQGTPLSQKASPAPASTKEKPPQRLKLILSSTKNANAEKEREREKAEASRMSSPTATPKSPVSPSQRDAVFGPIPHDCLTRLSHDERSMPRKDLYRLLRRQIAWATRESAELEQENAAAEKTRLKEYMAKELVLENLLEVEFSRTYKRDERKRARKGDYRHLNSATQRQQDILSPPDEDIGEVSRTKLDAMEENAKQSRRLPLMGRSVPRNQEKPSRARRQRIRRCGS